MASVEEGCCPKCPAGHALKKEPIPYDAVCDACHSRNAKQTPMWRCAPCQYDLCDTCGVKDPSQHEHKGTSASYQSADNTINRAKEGGQFHTDEKQINKLEELKQKGRLSDRTVADYLNEQGTNPYAADQMGLKVLIAFRRKMFATLLIQCSVVLALAWGVANIPMVKEMQILYTKDNIIRDGAICAFFFLSSVVSLGVVGICRYHFPINIAALAVFTVFMSITLACLAGPNVHLGMLAILFGFSIVFLPCSFIIRKRVIEVFPVTFFGMVVTNAVIVGWMVMYGTFMSWGYAALLMIINSVGMVWSGYEIDRLCARLKVDEYLLPVILLWAELLLTIFIICSVETMCEAAGSFEGGCSMWAHTTWHCDCWIYDNGSYGKDKYRKAAATTSEEGAAPKQEAMQEGSAAPAGKEELATA